MLYRGLSELNMPNELEFCTRKYFSILWSMRWLDWGVTHIQVSVPSSSGQVPAALEEVEKSKQYWLKKRVEAKESGIMPPQESKPVANGLPKQQKSPKLKAPSSFNLEDFPGKSLPSGVVYLTLKRTCICALLYHDEEKLFHNGQACGQEWNEWPGIIKYEMSRLRER